MVGRPAVRQNSGRFQIFTILDHIREWSLTKVQCYYNVTNAFQSVFSGKVYCEVRHVKVGHHALTED